MCSNDWDDYDFRLEPEPMEKREHAMCDFDDFDDLKIEDFAIIGGVIGYVEEQIEEERIQDRTNEGIEFFDENGAP
jgi:hypothetical protein